MYSESELQQANVQLEQALRRLQESHYKSWVGNFSNMIDFCQTNPIISAILKKHTKPGSYAAADQWFRDWENSGPKGKRKIKPIPSSDDGFGMNIKILEEFHKREIGIKELGIKAFCYATYTGRGHGDRYDMFYSDLIQPFADFIRLAINSSLAESQSREIQKERKTGRVMGLGVWIGIVTGVLGTIAAWLALFSE